MNPAVSLAFAVVKRLSWYKVPIYWTAQLLGAFTASACVYGVYYGECITLLFTFLGIYYLLVSSKHYIVTFKRCIQSLFTSCYHKTLI